MARSRPAVTAYDNPLDMIEFVADARDWPFDRVGEDEISVAVAGKWAHYQVSFSWHHELEGLHLACAFDFKVPDPRSGEVYRLIAHINEQLWLGHFDIWSSEGILMFRNGLLLCGDAQATADQCEGMLQLAVDACERYFPAFQYVIWAGRSAEEAVRSALFEPAGRA